MTQEKRYAVFIDLDRTLLTINSSIPLILMSYKRGLMKTPALLKAVWLSIIYKLRLKNAIDATNAMAFWLKGVPETTVAEISKQLVEEKLIPRLRPSMLQEIEQHRAHGARLVILSASLPYTCEPLAQQLKIDDMICSTMDVKKGLFTGKGNICIEKEKEIRMREYCRNTSIALKDVYAYGDSYSDRFVLKTCGHPVAVSPDKRLRTLARRYQWNIIK